VLVGTADETSELRGLQGGAAVAAPAKEVRRKSVLESMLEGRECENRDANSALPLEKKDNHPDPVRDGMAERSCNTVGVARRFLSRVYM
jgi:hypothetical protein